jgi:hypothetical protein
MSKFTRDQWGSESDYDKNRGEGAAHCPQAIPQGPWLGHRRTLAVLRLGDGLVLLPEQQRFEHLCEQVGSALTRVGVTPEALLA